MEWRKQGRGNKDLNRPVGCRDPDFWAVWGFQAALQAWWPKQSHHAVPDLMPPSLSVPQPNSDTSNQTFNTHTTTFLIQMYSFFCFLFCFFILSIWSEGSKRQTHKHFIILNKIRLESKWIKEALLGTQSTLIGSKKAKTSTCFFNHKAFLAKVAISVKWCHTDGGKGKPIESGDLAVSFKIRWKAPSDQETNATLINPSTGLPTVSFAVEVFNHNYLDFITSWSQKPELKVKFD